MQFSGILAPALFHASHASTHIIVDESFKENASLSRQALSVLVKTSQLAFLAFHHKNLFSCDWQKPFFVSVLSLPLVLEAFSKSSNGARHLSCSLAPLLQSALLAHSLAALQGPLRGHALFCMSSNFLYFTTYLKLSSQDFLKQKIQKLQQSIMCSPEKSEHSPNSSINYSPSPLSKSFVVSQIDARSEKFGDDWANKIDQLFQLHDSQTATMAAEIELLRYENKAFKEHMLESSDERFQRLKIGLQDIYKEDMATQETLLEKKLADLKLELKAIMETMLVKKQADAISQFEALTLDHVEALTFNHDSLGSNKSLLDDLKLQEARRGEELNADQLFSKVSTAVSSPQASPIFTMQDETSWSVSNAS